MDLKIVENLLALMQEGGLTELHYVQGETEIRLSRQQDNPAPVVYATPAHGAPMAAAPAPVAAAAPAAAPEAPAEDENAEYFRSPMVGTFYRKPSPDADAYANAGDSVDGETVLCLIEAMKVFNEIKAEFSGTILEALVKDGEAVEYDQPLFKIRTS
ncbi:MAG: acetyl-CoA carboxylase biotin carboxyl carrier protein [Planctomycetes bacterium]|nr:acetyl-CoA carboxylase biotin carboxyl carrier protein [Planctomycetota bacterium]MCP4772420.1 acetyl-CoA carboxylase biotin carboxyl carrier protein [Planctomycetota bacterium]MCP4860187.1 acetyl-CoA carboxylase biotin carboxyl carrier protein [Planctomycetota bacterium]